MNLRMNFTSSFLVASMACISISFATSWRLHSFVGFLHLQGTIFRPINFCHNGEYPRCSKGSMVKKLPSPPRLHTSRLQYASFNIKSKWYQDAKWYVMNKSSSSSCRATSTDILDPLSIVHRFWQVLRAISCILTELLYVDSSWSPCFSFTMCGGL